MGYLISKKKEECFGCEACVQVCNRGALSMEESEEGFRYPVINEELCVNCGLCQKVCPHDKILLKNERKKYVFGGYTLDEETRFESTSGGAFSAIVEVYCDENYVIFGAEARGLLVFHSYITDKSELSKFRKSKYLQSIIGKSYTQVKQFLKEGKKVLFSGTPCQIAGLKAYLGNINQERLLTVEVICEGVPSPLYMRKYEKYLEKKYGEKIKSLDYRYTGKSLFDNGKWDFQQMKSDFGGGGKWDFEIMRVELMKKKTITKDRWFNPFWSIWLNHLMSRPSCYECPYARPDRGADITLGDLWGVHLYCPELYGKNGGSSLVVCNTEKGERVFKKAQEQMYGHELLYEDALKYQGSMRKHISMHPQQQAFMNDLQNAQYDYKALNKKWVKPPTLKLLWHKYIWGNRQKIWVWNISHRHDGK